MCLKGQAEARARVESVKPQTTQSQNYCAEVEKLPKSADENPLIILSV